VKNPYFLRMHRADAPTRTTIMGMDDAEARRWAHVAEMFKNSNATPEEPLEVFTLTETVRGDIFYAGGRYVLGHKIIAREND